MKYALINAAGLVENVILLTASNSWPTPDGYTLVATDIAGPGWTWDGTHFVAPPVEVPPVSLPDYAANARWLKEVGGISVGGTSIATDRQSQAMISGAHAYVQANPSAIIQWKGTGGFVALDAATITAIAIAVGEHVQACFAKEAEVVAAIAAGTITTPQQIDEAFSDA